MEEFVIRLNYSCQPLGANRESYLSFIPYFIDIEKNSLKLAHERKVDYTQHGIRDRKESFNIIISFQFTALKIYVISQMYNRFINRATS